MKSNARAGELKAALDPRHMKHCPYPLTITVFSRGPNPLVMTVKLKKKPTKEQLNLSFHSQKFDWEGENCRLLKYIYSCPQR